MGCKDNKVDACPTTIIGYCDKVERVVSAPWCSKCKGRWQLVKSNLDKARKKRKRMINSPGMIRINEPEPDAFALTFAKAGAMQVCGQQCGKNKTGECTVTYCDIRQNRVTECPEGRWTIDKLIEKAKQTGV